MLRSLIWITRTRMWTCTLSSMIVTWNIRCVVWSASMTHQTKRKIWLSHHHRAVMWGLICKHMTVQVDLSWQRQPWHIQAHKRWHHGSISASRHSYAYSTIVWWFLCQSRNLMSTKIWIQQTNIWLLMPKSKCCFRVKSIEMCQKDIQTYDVSSSNQKMCPMQEN